MNSLVAAVSIGYVLARQCTNSDYEFWASYGQTFSNFLNGCASREWGNAEKTSQCLLNDPMNKLSESCATCFGDYQACAQGECWFQCGWDSTSNWCLKCIDGSECPGELTTCSGYESANLPPKPNGSIEGLPTNANEIITTSSTTPMMSTVAVPSGNCTSTDHALWTSYGEAYSNYIAHCGQQAWGSANETSKCLEESGLSSPCSTCFGNSVECGRDECIFSCFSGPASSTCLSCIAETECNQILYNCTGYKAADMPPPPTDTGRLPETPSTQVITSPTTSTTSQEPTSNATTSTTSQEPTTKATTSTTSQEPTSNATTSTTSQEPTTKATTSTTSQEPTTKATTSTTSQEPTTKATTSTTSQEPTTKATTSTTSQEPTTKATTLSPTASSPVVKTTPSFVSCAEADKQCRSVYHGSYCKYWKTVPVCHGTDAPCSCSTPSFSTGAKPHPGLTCDAACAAEDPNSYCKHWQVPPVCFATNTPCSC